MRFTPRQSGRLLRALVRAFTVWGLAGWLVGAVVLGTAVLAL